MIERYTLPLMKQVWEPESKFNKWLSIEIMACEAMAELGKITEKEKDAAKKEKIKSLF